jgi:hypothetical protein
MVVCWLGSVECYKEWYHLMAFILVTITIVFPFSLIFMVSRSEGMEAVRRQLTIIYRTKQIGIFGQVWICLCWPFIVSTR